MFSIIKKYAGFSDDRGEFCGVLNEGNWGEVNYVFTKKGAIRGNHFHKNVVEIVFLLKGEMTVEVSDIKDSNILETVHLKAGEGIRLEPYLYHVMKYDTDCEQLSILDQPFEENNPDIHRKA
jgi:dTDP-4-dehydrorhamnose 3,5-epimerase-like enzyme